MFRRLAWLIALFFALCIGPANAAIGQQRIVAVGDLHGDFQAWLTIARAAGLIDSRNHWTARNTTLVQLGDIADRQPDTLKIIRNLQQLQEEAPAKAAVSSSCSAITRR